MTAKSEAKPRHAKNTPPATGGSVAQPREQTVHAGTSPKITDAFDHVYVINCAHRPDRLVEFKEDVESKGVADFDKIKVVRGVIGDYTTHPSGWGGGNGAWGCLRSHMRILEDLMHERDERGDVNWNSALILEDDVFFLDGALEQLNAFMGAIPHDWGQAYLGGQHRQRATPTISPHVLLGNSINRTHAYAVSRLHIQAIYRHITYMADYHSNKHIDHQLELAHNRKDWPVYCPPKWICGQRAGTSNISGRNLQAQTWQ